MFLGANTLECKSSREQIDPGVKRLWIINTASSSVWRVKMLVYWNLTSDIVWLIGGGSEATRTADAVICSLRMHPLVDADPQNYQNLRTDSDMDKLQSRLHTAMDCGCGSSVTLWTEVIKFYDLHTSSDRTHAGMQTALSAYVLSWRPPSVASSAVFPPNWAVFQTHWAGNFRRLRVAFFWAVSNLPRVLHYSSFGREPMVSWYS